MNLDLIRRTTTDPRSRPRLRRARAGAPRPGVGRAASIFPRDVFTQMGALGFAGMLVPEEYGGVGADTLSLHPHAGRD